MKTQILTDSIDAIVAGGAIPKGDKDIEFMSTVFDDTIDAFCCSVVESGGQVIGLNFMSTNEKIICCIIYMDKNDVDLAIEMQTKNRNGLYLPEKQPTKLKV